MDWTLVDVGGMSPKGDTDIAYQVVSSSGDYVCDLVFGTFRKEQKGERELADVNAKLIVADPEMLEALKKIQTLTAFLGNDSEYSKQILEAASSVIGKAEASFTKVGE